MGSIVKILRNLKYVIYLGQKSILQTRHILKVKRSIWLVNIKTNLSPSSLTYPLNISELKLCAPLRRLSCVKEWKEECFTSSVFLQHFEHVLGISMTSFHTNYYKPYRVMYQTYFVEASLKNKENIL